MAYSNFGYCAYSNFGYCVVGRAIEKVTGKSYSA
jgi:CubicO group peptidase (beta-lactamase class C family)